MYNNKLENFVVIFLNDILVYTHTLEAHGTCSVCSKNIARQIILCEDLEMQVRQEINHKSRASHK